MTTAMLVQVLLCVSIVTNCALGQGNPPVWMETLAEALNTIGIRENTPVGTRLGFLRAEDPEGQGVTYATERDVVEVNSATGRVTLARELDRETESQVPLYFTARDPAGNIITQEYTMTVLDVQDSPPVFENAPISLRVQENLPPNELLEPEIQVRDGDTGVPHALSIVISEDTLGLFQIASINEAANLYNVRISTRTSLDREAISSLYSFKVRANELNNGVETGIFTEIVVSVNIVDVNDVGPTFNQDTYVVMLKENPDRTQIPGLNMIVTDPDEDNNAHFELSIQDVSGNEFEEPKSDIYTISPASGTSSASVTLTINQNLYFDYEIDMYRQHIFEIVARETLTSEQRSSTATVTINLEDQNDNFPRFNESLYRASIREDRPVGYFIDTITAEDIDSAEFADLTYSLRGTGSDSFNVNPTTGEIRLAIALNFEEVQIFRLEYVADDNAGREQSVPFVVTVLDFNDQGPIFSADEYRTRVGETNINLNPPITVQALDADSDLPVTFRIIGGNVDDVFELHPNTGVLTLKRPVSYDETPDRQGYFELIVEASDNGDPEPQTAAAIIIVTVQDENNNRPRFGDKIYNRQVRESSPSGTPVVTVQATDIDSGMNAAIDYVIYRGSIDNFEVNHETGRITVAPNADLDIERNGDHYTMIVHAIDRGSPPLTGTATVYVTVIDANNKIPTFGQDVYILSVREDTEPDTVIETLSAVDPDDTASVRYRINGSIQAFGPSDTQLTDPSEFDYLNAFKVDDRTGAISTNLPLDHDVIRVVRFDLLAEDMNAEDPLPQIGRARVTINILDIGGTDVTFQPPWNDPEYVIHIMEEQPISTLITQLVATDPTGGSAMTYREVAGSDPNNYFGINGENGQIVVNKRLDYETLPPAEPPKELSFQVRAFTSGPDVRTAAATVKIIVEDINDNAPTFLRTSYPVSISEAEEYPTVIERIEAEDRDSGNFSNIIYSISGPGAEMFYIDPELGTLYVQANVTLDRDEGIPVYHLFVTATDNPGSDDSRPTTVSLTISLDDENDNAPVFTRNEYEIQTPDKRERNRILGFVTARDADAGNNGKVVYTMISGDSDLFRVESNGTIRSNKSPTLEGSASVEPYRLVIRAQDSGADPQHTDVIVFIYIQDSQTQGGAPVISYPGEDGASINMTEESEPGTNVTRINATSNDPNARLTFSFVVNDELSDAASKFYIDPVTGLITVLEQLDGETQSRYELIIMVRDNKEPPGETVRRIFIDLTDINDNFPTFDCPESPFRGALGARVFENRNQTYVTRVRACDPDGEETPIYFYIISGNNPDEHFDGERPFRIDATGAIFTDVPLDREHIERYILTVKATNVPELSIQEEEMAEGESSENGGGRRKRDSHTVIVNDEIDVIVTVDDEDDNGPVFIGPDGSRDVRIVEGIIMTARPGTEITQFRAADADAMGNNVYSLKNEIYYDSNNKAKSTPYAFIIDSYSGVVETNLEDYIKYVDGYFEMLVVATDGQNRRAQATLSIFVVRESQRLRFIFDEPPDETAKDIEDFLEEVAPFFSNMVINEATLRYHAKKSGGRIDFGKSDLCFHVIKNNNEVLNADVALDEFELQYNRKKELRELYDTYDVDKVDVCEVKETTRWWSGYWWLWWWLIALALFILLVALICICIICICWPRYLKHSEREKPYRVFEGSTILPPASDYEWQEEIVRMQ